MNSSRAISTFLAVFPYCAQFSRPKESDSAR
jgi:hypothetical protein